MILCSKTPPIGATVICLTSDGGGVWARARVLAVLPRGESLAQYLMVQIFHHDGDVYWDNRPRLHQQQPTTWVFGGRYLTFWFREEENDSV